MLWRQRKGRIGRINKCNLDWDLNKAAQEISHLRLHIMMLSRISVSVIRDFQLNMEEYQKEEKKSNCGMYNLLAVLGNLSWITKNQTRLYRGCWWVPYFTGWDLEDNIFNSLLKMILTIYCMWAFVFPLFFFSLNLCFKFNFIKVTNENRLKDKTTTGFETKQEQSPGLIPSFPLTPTPQRQIFWIILVIFSYTWSSYSEIKCVLVFLNF